MTGVQTCALPIWFGCGLRQLLFARVSDALQATMRIQVTQALGQALGGVINVTGVAVSTSDGSAAPEPGTFQVTVSYTLVDTQTSEQTTVTLV